MTATYDEWLKCKSVSIDFDGIDNPDICDRAFPHQRDLIAWALRRGRAAIFADTGLGKSLCELEWARNVARFGRVIILAPLAVATQIVKEGKEFGIEATYARDDSGKHRIVVTNYEMMSHFDPREFAGVVLDESSILKSFTGKTRTALINAWANTPYRLACTATPAPNDFTELGNHSEFLGIRSRTEMLAEYFVHDGGSTQNWRLKGHAIKPFWRWVSSWGAIIRLPSDIGYDDTDYLLPPLVFHEHVVPVDHRTAWKSGLLFAPRVAGLAEARAARRESTPQRIELAATLADINAPTVVWCELNAESKAAHAAIRGSVEVCGSDNMDVKRSRLEGFASGVHKVLVTKPSIAGFGLNWQHCANVIFVGASYSYEQTYQAIRRCWRFGQKRQVNVHIIRAETESAVIEAYRRKEAAAKMLADEIRPYLRDEVRSSGTGQAVKRWKDYTTTCTVKGPQWLKQ